MADIINPLSPAEMQVQQQAIDRQRKIAEYLQQQSMTPDQGQMVSGHYVAPSSMQYLAKLAQGLLGKSQQESLDKKQMGIATQQGDTLRSEFGIGNQNTPQMSSPNVPAAVQDGLTQGAQAGSVGPTNDNLERVAQALQNQQQAPAQPSPQQTGSRVIPGMSPMMAFRMYNSDPKTYDEAFLRQFDPTDTMKNNKALGISNAEAAAAERARLAKAGMLEIAPGNTVKNLATGGYEVAPDFKTGIAGGFDANGKPTMGKIAGSNAIAELAGDAKRAEAAGAAGYNMTKVDTPSGPVMMTAEQAAQLSGGGQQSPQPINFTASNGVKLNFEGMTPQQLFDQISATKDPAAKQDMTQAFSEWMRGGQKQQVGIKLQSDAEKEDEVGKVKLKNSVEEAKLKNAQSPENQQKITDAKQVISLLDAAEPLIKKATGSLVGSIRDQAGGMVGMSSPASEASAQLKALGGSLVSKMPKMSGPQSDKDVLLYKEMAGQIGDPTVPQGNKLAALKVVRELNQKYIEDNANSITNEALESTQRKPKSSIDDLLKKYGGK